MNRVRSAFLLGVLALMPACGRTEHRDASAPPSDAGVESARPLADSAVPSTDGAGPAVEAAIPVTADGAGPAVETAMPATADGAGPAVETPILVTADGAADRVAGDLLSAEVAILFPDAVPDSPVDASPEAAFLQTDGAADGGDVNQMLPMDGGADGGTLDLATALSGKTLTYWVTTEWRRPDGGSSFLPTEQDFVTVTPYAKDVGVFSADGSTLQLTSVQGVRMPMAGTRLSTDQGKWTYRLTSGTGGEFVVWISGTTIVASKILYGSGLPVVESTRGELRAN